MMKKTIKLLLVTMLLVVAYQSQAQQNGGITLKKKRMFFYPSQENPPVLVVQPLNIYPNPTSQYVEINLPAITDRVGKDAFVLNVFDKQGTSILSQTWTGEKLDVSAFQPGVYIVTLRKNKLVYSQKLVVARE
ncbi:T9SS type A sorting domain-containing protein [Dyadobacter arcticus]|uniref:Secretion system C-terminal sorting domain-containing protein n=1 Tax=Dyadobacter arcticus TaxID=1078754 RepID=A0ABX0UHI0_9BACT|nr:T9SS type A sorting domain-containing protein [Dyadobacter arcticus]NIJ52377.1 hypothetical protein [Dyadobacter arcticus]